MTRPVLRFLILGWLGATAGLRAQQPAPSAGAGATGSISGLVIDATSSAPIARASVTLTPADGFGVLSNARLAPSSLLLAHTTTTSMAGAYRFSDLAIGVYHLYVQRIGFTPAILEVRLGETGTSALSIGLVVVPVRLRAVEVHATDLKDAIDVRFGAMTDDARVAAARARQQAYLSTDARE